MDGHTYQHIRTRHLDNDHSLANWAFIYSDNEYVPFGSIRHGEKDAYEYLQRRQSVQERIYQEQIDKHARKNRQLRRAKVISDAKAVIDKAHQTIYEYILNLPPEDQVEVILADTKHSIYFYTPIILRLLDRQDVTDLPWHAILKRLDKQKRTPFNKRLTRIITQRIKNK